jgi:hypothetical protein
MKTLLITIFAAAMLCGCYRSPSVPAAKVDIEVTYPKADPTATMKGLPVVDIRKNGDTIAMYFGGELLSEQDIYSRVQKMLGYTKTLSITVFRPKGQCLQDADRVVAKFTELGAQNVSIFECP